MCKKIILVFVAVFALLGLSTATFASFSNQKVYIGGQLLKANMHYDGSSYTLPTNSVDDRVWGGRFYMGYSFTDLLAAELGYDFYGQPEFKHDPTGNKQEMSQQGLDLVGRLNIPFDYGFGLYIKGGGMWVHRDSLESRGGFFANKNSDDTIVPAGGIGLSYNFNQSWSIDLSWTVTPTINDLPKMYIYGIGLAYRFHHADDISNSNNSSGSNSGPTYSN